MRVGESYPNELATAREEKNENIIINMIVVKNKAQSGVGFGTQIFETNFASVPTGAPVFARPKPNQMGLLLTFEFFCIQSEKIAHGNASTIRNFNISTVECWQAVGFKVTKQ